MNNEATTVLATLIRHRGYINASLEALACELRARGHLHDQSKLEPNELEGFIEINRVAREHGPGTPEYEAVLRDADCIVEHFSKNSHHPEHHAATSDMGWLDIIEMVLDWKAAADTYGQRTLRGSLDYQRKRHDFSDSQWWLIMQVVDWVEPQVEPGTYYCVTVGEDSAGAGSSVDEKLGELEQWGATLHGAWRAGAACDVIFGTWAEDDTRYSITVPSRLREQILKMQNALHKRYVEETDGGGLS